MILQIELLLDTLEKICNGAVLGDEDIKWFLGLVSRPGISTGYE